MMIETKLIVAALAVVAERVLQSASDDYLKGKLQPLLGALERKKESPQTKAVKQSYGRLCITVQGGLDLLGEGHVQYTDDLAKFIKDPHVFLEFLKPFDSPTSTVAINDEFLAGRWVDLRLKRLPDGFPWNTVAQACRNVARRMGGLGGTVVAAVGGVVGCGMSGGGPPEQIRRLPWHARR